MKTRNFALKSLTVLVLLLFISFYTKAQEKPKVQLISSGELISKGLKYVEAEEYQKAIDTYKKVSRNDTNYSWALLEMCATYTDMKKYDEAIECCKQGLKLFDKSHEVNFYIGMANNYDDIDSGATALKIYKEALELYPYNQSLIYNYGAALYKNKFYNEAEKVLIKSLTINPFHANSHLHLGYINILKGKFLQGVLCLNTVLLMRPGGELGNHYLTILENAFNGSLEKELRKNNPDVPSDGEVSSNFQDIEALIKSEFALNKKFKTKAKLSYIVTKQDQLIFDQLKPDKEQKDFYSRFYIPLFRNIADEGYVEEFSYYILQSTEDKDVQSWLESKAGKAKKFAANCGEFIINKRQFGFDPENEKDKKVYYYFSEKHSLKSYGSYSDKKEKVREGLWHFYYTNGTLETTATYEKGKLNGSSTYYNRDRSIEKTLNYVNDEIEGPAIFYNAYSEKQSEFTTKKSKIVGTANYYNSSGTLDQTYTFVDGKVKGPGKIFYYNGQLKQEFTKVEDKFQGPAKTYHPDGSPDMVSTLKDGKINGDYVNYFSNGNKKSEGKFLNGDRTGKWLDYFNNGKVKSETTYNDKGKIIGTVKNYYLSGTVHSVENYGSNGKMDGKSTYYDYDGKLYNEFVYKNDKIDEVFFYDKAGKQIKHFEAKKNSITLEFLYPNGNIRYSGTFKDGDEDGLFKYYNASGTLTSEQNYKKGKKNGKFTAYFPNGKPKEVGAYVDGMLDGYVTFYHSNGIISEEGWYKDGKLEGDWYNYHMNGTIAGHSFYVNGENHGFIEYYNQDGRKYLEQFYNEGLFLRYTQFDSLGNIYNDCELKAGKGKLKKLNYNGTLLESSTMIMGSKYDTIKQFNAMGILTTYGYAIEGNYHGLKKTFNDNGQIMSEINYVFGSKEGKETNYEDDQISSTYQYVDGDLEYTAKIYKDGKLKVEIPYVRGDKEGYSIYYAPDGQVAYRLLFVRESISAYSYLDKSGKYVADIPVKDGKAKIVCYYQNGKKSVDFEILNGERNGLKTEYYPDGKVREESNLLFGLLHGKYKEYFPSGKLRSESDYSYDLHVGVAKFYNSNGTIKKECNYENGEYNGLVKLYNQSGKLLKTRRYYYDSLIEETSAH